MIKKLDIHAAYWNGQMGDGINKWYLENVIESAKEAAASPTPPVKLYLPGIFIRPSYHLEYS